MMNEDVTVYYDEKTDEVVEECSSVEGTKTKRYKFDEYVEECSDGNYRDLLETLPLHIKIEKEMQYEIDELKDAYLELYYRCREKEVLVEAEYKVLPLKSEVEVKSDVKEG